MTTPITIIVRSSYTEAQKRASYKWNAANVEKVKEMRRNYHQSVKNRSQPFYNLCKMIDALNHPEWKPKRKYTKRH